MLKQLLRLLPQPYQNILGDIELPEDDGAALV